MPRLTVAVPLTALTLSGKGERSRGGVCVSNSPSSRRRRRHRPPAAVEAEDVVADDDLDDAARHAAAPSSASRGGRGRWRFRTGTRHWGQT